jgi:hypothetical protein
MKKIFALMIIILAISSCKKLQDLNTNTKNPLKVSGESLFTGAQVNLFQEMVTPNSNYNIWRLIAQQWTETTYTDESNYDLIDKTIPDNHWNWMYQYVIKDLDQASKIIASTAYPFDPGPAVKKNRLAIIEILTVYSWSNLVETFGNVPYSQALNINNLLPAYDDGLKIYENLIVRLDTAIVHLDPAYSSLDEADQMYHGDVAAWAKFANSLRLRMGMLLSDADPVIAKAAVERAVADENGLISSNSDNARLVYMSQPPNTNPIYDELVASGRHDYIPANTLVDTMNRMNDPRLPLYFTQVDTSSSGDPQLVYLGGIYGESNDFTSYSHVADQLQVPTFEGLIFDYSETEFLLAEGAERGYNIGGGSAQEHYNNAIGASITYWGGSDSDVKTYLADRRVAYNTAPGDYKRKIGFQKWIALYNRGFEAWTEWRKFNYPILIAPPRALSAIPLRFTYPIEEQTLNGANYAAASAAIGGDLVTTRLFWDKP